MIHFIKMSVIFSFMQTPFSSQRYKYIVSFFARSCSWLPCSMIFPSFITRIRSASLIVDSLCATIKLVLPSIRRVKALWIFSSVLVSMEEVASSRISIGGSASMIREIHKSCFCPCESIPPSSPITVSYPFGIRRINGSA